MVKKSPSFSISPLKKAAISLKEVVQKKKTDIIRDATIQRFEYTFELVWKTLRRYLQLNSNIREFNLKEIFREAGKQGLIGKVEAWFNYLESRNLTSHTYYEEIAEKVYKVAKRFSDDVDELIKKLEKLIG